VKDKIKLLELNEDLLKRSVNEGFSGGEKKRATKFSRWPCSNRSWPSSTKRIPAWTLTRCKHRRRRRQQTEAADNAQLVITHYQRLLNYIVPDFVHVLVDGRIVKSGDKESRARTRSEGLRLDSQGTLD
jgi:Fe-S cluster assembly ATP-binding protein